MTTCPLIQFRRYAFFCLLELYLDNLQWALRNRTPGARICSRLLYRWPIMRICKKVSDRIRDVKINGKPDDALHKPVVFLHR
jgi:hypothetical protein